MKRKVKRNRVPIYTLWAVLAFFGMALLPAPVKAVTPEMPECVLPHGGGGDVPSPFEAVNQYVELAEGEMYTLTGTVESRSSAIQSEGMHYFFKVDLEEHPWLANHTRRSDPSYPLEVSGAGGWARYLEKKVRITVQAHGKYVFNSFNGDMHYQIGLVPVDGTPIQLLKGDELRK